MPSQFVSAEDAEGLDMDGLLQRLGSDRQGLSGQAAQERLSRFGSNALEEEKTTPPVAVPELLLGSHTLDDRGGRDPLGGHRALAGLRQGRRCGLFGDHRQTGG